MLRCSDGSFYTGHTDDLEYRIEQHKDASIPCYTSTRLPIELVFSQDCPTRADAIILERQIKGWSRAKKEALIVQNWKKIQELSIRYSQKK